MNMSPDSIPNATIEALARSFYKEAIRFGFKQVDYLRFVNFLLDMSLKNDALPSEAEKPLVIYTQAPVHFPLEGDHVLVREFIQTVDKKWLDKWLTDVEGRHFLQSRIASQIVDLDRLIHGRDNVLGMICLKSDPEIPIGALAFLDYDQTLQQAELRKLIGEPIHRGKGLAKEATRLWIQYGISALGLKKIYLFTLETNIRNIKLNQELGFQVERIFRNAILIDGEYFDILKMSYKVD